MSLENHQESAWEEEGGAPDPSVDLERKGLSDEINQIIFNVLKFTGRSAHYHLFKDNPETLPLIANAVNYLAKNTEYSDELYADKKVLTTALLKEHPATWESHGVQYSETPFGQISFHVFEDEPYLANTQQLGIHPEGREFSQENLQSKALELLDTYIDEATHPKSH